MKKVSVNPRDKLKYDMPRRDLAGRFSYDISTGIRTVGHNIPILKDELLNYIRQGHVWEMIDYSCF